MNTCTCRICATPRETRATDYFAAGPADLCALHYNRWFRLYDQAGGINNDEAYSTALALLSEEYRQEQQLVAC